MGQLTHIIRQTHTPLLMLFLALSIGCASTNKAKNKSTQDTLQGSPPTSEAAYTSPSQGHNPKALRRGYLWYKITAHKDHMSVTLRLLRPPPRVNFFLPGTWAGRDDWATRLQLKGARSPQGKLSMTLQPREGRIDLEMHTPQPWVELQYDVLLTKRKGKRDRFVPQKLAKNSGFFLYAPTFLILPSERIASIMRDIIVEVSLPKSLEPLTTWQSAGAKASTPNIMTYGYLVPDVRALRDAYLAGHADFKWSRSPFITLAAEPTYQGDVGAMGAYVSSLIQQYQARFGPLKNLKALVRVPHKSKTVRWGTGRQNGFVLELGAKAKLDQDTQLLIAHEAFHLWNGHQLEPRPKAEVQTRWFKEGITQYIALRTLLAMGDMNSEQFLEEIAKVGTRYQRDIQAKAQEPSVTLGAHHPYDQGLLLALALDGMLRAHNKTLDHWIDSMITRAKRHTLWRYDQEALWHAYSQQLPSEARGAKRFWRKHITQKRPLNLTQLFSGIGLHWLEARPNRPARLIPLANAQNRWSSFLQPPSS